MARPFQAAYRTFEEVSKLVAMGFYFLIFALMVMLVTALAPRLNGRTGGTA